MFCDPSIHGWPLDDNEREIQSFLPHHLINLRMPWIVFRLGEITQVGDGLVSGCLLISSSPMSVRTYLIDFSTTSLAFSA